MENLPIKKIWYKPIEYWDCGKADHHHASREVALKCMNKATSAKALTIKQVLIRRCAIARDLLDGHTQVSIASKFNVSTATVKSAITGLAHHARNAGYISYSEHSMVISYRTTVKNKMNNTDTRMVIEKCIKWVEEQS